MRYVRGHATRGKSLSEEHKQKFLGGRRGAKNTAEHNRKIKEAMLGAKGPAWRGGRIIREGRALICVGKDHPHADSRGYVYEHRLVAQEFDPAKHVHHRDGNPLNNSPENLVVLTRGEHMSLHNLMRKGYTADGAERLVLGRRS
jgi:hypothetical protein